MTKKKKCEVFILPDLRDKKKIQLIQKWCECENSKVFRHPQRGKCPCGIDYTHRHCKCGGITKIGDQTYGQKIEETK